MGARNEANGVCSGCASIPSNILLLGTMELEYRLVAWEHENTPF